MKLSKEIIRNILLEELDRATVGTVIEYAADDIVNKLESKLTVEDISNLPIFTTERMLERLITKDLLNEYGLAEDHRYHVLDKAVDKVKSHLLFSEDSA
jgi:hypothetical protein